MRVTCPACAAQYEVPDRMIGPEGRRLRCARCAHQWTAHPGDDFLDTEAAGHAPPPQAADRASAFHGPEGEAPGGDRASLPPGFSAFEEASRSPGAGPGAPAPAPRRAPHVIEPPLPTLGDEAAQRGGRLALGLAWAATVLFVLGLGAVLALFPTEIVAAWPPAARFYLAIGLIW